MNPPGRACMLHAEEFDCTVDGMTICDPQSGTRRYRVDEDQYEYDVGLSFAGEQRGYVEDFARDLKSRGVRVFYDDYEKAGLWGKDLYSHLAQVYGEPCRYCILFASAEYADKVWTNHERRSAQARVAEHREYILPVRFDDTPIPGLLKTVHYIDQAATSMAELLQLTLQKLGNPQRRDYLPPVPDRLYDFLEVAHDPDAPECAFSQALSFLGALRRMTPDERQAVFGLFHHGCRADLPYNVHINTDLLRRVTGKPVPVLKSLLGGLRSLGFQCTVREATEDEHPEDLQGEPLGESYLFELNWVDLSDPSDYPALVVASAMVDLATENYCEEHGGEFLERLDFSQLASATHTTESHGD